MGFLQVAMNGVKVTKTVAKVAVKVGKAIVECAKVVKKKLDEKREKDKSKLDNAVKSTKKDVEKKASENAKMFDEQSYDVDRMSVSDVQNLNKSLYQMQDSLAIDSRALEEDIISYLQNTIDEMFDDILTFSQEYDLNINVSRLRSMSRKLKGSIRGFVQKNVQKKISLDNEELVNILKMSDSNAKHYKLEKFQKQVFADSVNELYELILNDLYKLNSEMFSIIEDRLCDLQIEAESKIDKLKDLEKSKQASEDEVRKKQHVLQYIVGASDWCLANLD